MPNFAESIKKLFKEATTGQHRLTIFNLVVLAMLLIWFSSDSFQNLVFRSLDSTVNRIFTSFTGHSQGTFDTTPFVVYLLGFIAVLVICMIFIHIHENKTDLWEKKSREETTTD